MSDPNRFPTRTGLVNTETLFRGSANLPKVLKQMGFPALRAGQEPVITNILGQRDTICVLPTATGKSACFMIPTLCLGWKSLVFSPLVALMRDQVQSAQAKGIKAAEVSGTRTEGENAMSLRQWAAGELSLLYCAPERVNNADFQDAVNAVKPDMMVLDECFTPDVEILTECGFVRFDELDPSYRCAQYHLDGQITFVSPTEHIAREHDGEMIRIFAKKKCDLPMTPQHQLLLRYGRDYKKESVSDVKFNYLKNIPVAGIYKSHISDLQELTPLEKLHIAYQADGSWHNDRADGTTGASFTFTKQRKISRFLSIMEAGQFEWSEVCATRDRRRFLVRGVVGLSKQLSDNFRLLDLNEARRRAFIEEVAEWDGSRISQDLLYYSSKLKANVDFVQAMAVITGYKTNQILQEDSRKETFSDMHRLFISKSRDWIGTQKIEKIAEHYTGKVYCVRVPSGNIIVRRRGKPVVIGNCHCLSDWSDTFRPSYCHVGDYVSVWNPKVVAAFSATMSPHVEADVRRVLGIKEARKLVYYPRRTNLKLFSTEWIDSWELGQRIKDVKGASIVYCSTIKRVEDTAQELSVHLPDKQITIYHGELAGNEKRLNQDAFMEGHADIVVATNAFGMGIDKADIRAVFHRDLPGSPEALAQETGRAGRDGGDSMCLAYFSQRAVQTQMNFLDWGYPSRETVIKVYNFLVGACGPKNSCMITMKDIGIQAGVSEFYMQAVMAILAGSNVIKRTKSEQRVCEVSFTGETEDARFLRYKGAILKGGMKTGARYKVDQGWLCKTLGVSEGTVMKNLKDWAKDGVLQYKPPFVGATTEILGKPTLIDFNRLEAKERDSRTRFSKVLEYFETPDSEKHAFLESCFNIG